MAGFKSIDPSFDELVGPNAQLRRLLKHPQNQQLFHEAGVLITPDAENDTCGDSVVFTSNRLPCAEVGQRAILGRISVNALAPVQATAHHVGTNGTEQGAGISSNKDACFDDANIRDLSASAHAQKLWKGIEIDDLVACKSLAMPNGGCPWICADGSKGVLLCEQGLHAKTPKDDVHAALVEWSPASGASVVLDADAHGNRFTSLNDAAVHAQSGSVFFTDPAYGIEQGFKRPLSQGYAPNGLYIWHPKSGTVKLLDTRYDRSNGVTFVPDPSDPTSGRGILVTTDTGRFSFERESKDFLCSDMGRLTVDPKRPACIYAYAVDPPNSPDNLPIVHIDTRRHLFDSQSGVPDGIHHDERGNVWAGHGDGVHVYRPNWNVLLGRLQEASNAGSCAELIGKIILPSPRGVANFCWAGLASPASHCVSLYRVLLFAEDELWEALISVNGAD